MKTMTLSLLALVGMIGSSAMAQSEPKKTMDECCAKMKGDCCSTKEDNCCMKKMEGCCDSMKDGCCTWGYVTEGKRTVRRSFCVSEFRLPNTIRIEVRPEDRQPGDVEGYKTVGKHTERAYYRDVERKSEATSDSGCACSSMYVTVGKHSERRDFCEHNGVRMTCGQGSGECATCQK